MYFTFDLPNIYSGNYANTEAKNYEFKWIKNIGLNIFNYIKSKFNDQEINTIYSDYINIWKELMLNDSKNYLTNLWSFTRII